MFKFYKKYHQLPVILLLAVISACSGGGQEAPTGDDTTGSVDLVSPSGAGWSYCTSEGLNCSFVGGYEVAFGFDSSFNYGVYRNSVSCAESELGDPSPGKEKHCWIKAVTASNWISIEASNLQQEITLMGTDMERSQFFLNNASNAQQIADWVHKDINFDYSRVSYDRKQELVEGAPNLAFYNRAISSMKMIQQANPNVKFWATLKSDYDGYGKVNNLPDWVYTGGGYNGGSYDADLLNVENYARFLSDYLQYMSDNGVAISVLSVVKEWSQVVSAVKEVAVIKEIKRLLATTEYIGVPEPEFSGPSTWGAKTANTILNSYIDQNAIGLFNGISTHAYDGASEADWRTLVNNANAVGLPVWHTETGLGTGPTAGVELAINTPIARISSRAKWYRAGMQGELFFEPWSRGVANETRGIYFKNNAEGVRMRAYYIMKQFANHAPAGAHYISTSVTGLANVETMAFRHGDQLILWVMNGSDAYHSDTRIYVNGEQISPSSITSLAWYDGAESAGLATNLNWVDGSSFITEIDANTIVSYVFDLQ